MAAKNFILCRQCRIQKTCSCHFEASTFASNRLESGMRSALCKVCFRRRQGQSDSEIKQELKDIAFEIMAAQVNSDGSS